MTHYLFNQAGSIPGIPGTFANCRVDVDEDGAVHVKPLGSENATQPLEEAVQPVIEAEPEPPPIEEAPTIVTPPLMNGG